MAINKKLFVREKLEKNLDICLFFLRAMSIIFIKHQKQNINVDRYILKKFLSSLHLFLKCFLEGKNPQTTKFESYL